MPAWQHQGGVKRCSADAAARRSVQGLQLPELWVLWPIILLCHCYDALWTAAVLSPHANPLRQGVVTASQDDCGAQCQKIILKKTVDLQHQELVDLILGDS